MNKQKILSIIIYFALGFIFLGFIIGFIRFKTENEPLNIWGIKPMLILSGSMEPTIDLDSIVITIKTKKIKKGDIIMFKTASNDYVVHRYYDDNPDGTIVTKGDNNEIIDYEPVSSEDVFGKVIIRMNLLAPYISLVRNTFRI